MNLDLAPFMPEFRETAESLMVDTVTIDRWDGTRTQDPDTGKDAKNYGPPIYGPDVDTDDGRNGRAKIQQDAAISEEESGGGRVVTALRRELQLPVAAAGFQVDDRVTVVDSVWDPDLNGRVFRVSDLHGKTYATSRRLAIEEITS